MMIRLVVVIPLMLVLTTALAGCGQDADEDPDADRLEQSSDIDAQGDAAVDDDGLPEIELMPDGSLRPMEGTPTVDVAGSAGANEEDEVGAAEDEEEELQLIDTEALLAAIRARDDADRPVLPKGPPTITVLGALDKITARITQLEAVEDEETRFGTLVITARTCRSRPPEEPPETFAFLEVDDVNTSDERTRIFSGWMMASSPALNPLEHAVYDVWVIACRTAEAVPSNE